MNRNKDNITYIKFIIWGAGDRGNRILYHIGKDNIVAFIDSDKEKVGSTYENIKVIDFNEYKEKYSDICIVISTHEEEITVFLQKEKIYNYFCMSDCPEDFQTTNPRMILKNAIQKRIEKNKQYVIYGNSLYSILLYEWILEMDVWKKPYLLIETGTDINIIDSLKKQWGTFIVSEIMEIQQNIDRIYITVESENRNINKDIPLNMLKISENVLRYSEKINEYYNPVIDRYKNKHEGRRCFVIGTGPSLTYDDLNVLYRNNELCISVNSIYKTFKNTLWRPTYYMAADYRIMRDERVVFDYMKNIECFIGDTDSEFSNENHEENIIIYHDAQVWNNKGVIPFSDNLAQIIYRSGTIIYSAIELAVYLGCKEVYLLGVDASGINESYKKYRHMYDEKELVSTCFSNQVNVAYQSAKKYANEHEIKIYNATRGGELEVFKRVNFDDLF